MSVEKELAAEIRAFISKHAGIKPDYDPEFDDPEDRFTGPDASMLEAAAAYIEKERDIDFYVHSDWGSGTYHPYGDKVAKDWHDDLVSRANALRIVPSPR